MPRNYRYSPEEREPAKQRDKERRKAYYKKNKEEHNKKMREYYLKNKDKIKEYQKQNAEKIYENARIRRSEKLPINKVLYRNAKYRAKQKGLDFTITEEDCTAPKFCPVLGLELKIATGYSKDNSPSVDRINPSIGYVKGNVCIISHKANSIKNSASLDDLKKVLKYVEQYGS